MYYLSKVNKSIPRFVAHFDELINLKVKSKLGSFQIMKVKIRPSGLGHLQNQVAYPTVFL